MSVHEVFLYELTLDPCERTEPPLPVTELCDSCEWPPEQTYRLPCFDRTECGQWARIERSLSISHRSIDEWIRSIHDYTGLDLSEFDNLKDVFEQRLSNEQAHLYLSETLPKLAQLALQLPRLFPLSLPILVQNVNRCLHLTQQQVACLLANAFFCTLPRIGRSVEDKLPIANFYPLFRVSPKRNICNLVKIEVLLNYFRRVTTQVPIGTLSFYRRYLDDEQEPDWTSPISLSRTSSVKVWRNHCIEKCFDIRLQVDFANKRVGGSVLGRGCVQEEIRFVIWAELIASRVFTEVLTDRETFFITGAEQYADYEGYKEEFTFIADVQDSCPRDSMNRRQVCIVAIDALSFRNRPLSQFTETFLLRELNKAYAGFARQSALSSTESSETAHDLCSCSSAPVKARLSWDLCADDSAVATGNWGCGAYSGDKQYKFAIQLLACAHAGREMQFVMFEDDDFPSQIERFVEQIREHDWSGQQLFERLQAYNRHVETKLKERVSFFKFAFDSPGQVYESNDESKVSRRKVKRKGESDSKSSTN